MNICQEISQTSNTPDASDTSSPDLGSVETRLKAQFLTYCSEIKFSLVSILKCVCMYYRGHTVSKSKVAQGGDV